jgi:oligoendopeptidase F
MNPLLNDRMPHPRRPSLWNPPSDMADGLDLTRQRDRSRIPEQFTWKPEDIFPTIEDWIGGKKKLLDNLPALDRYKGRLASGPAALLNCLLTVHWIAKEYARLSVYAGMMSDIDTRDSAALARVQEMSQIGSDIAERSAYIPPEILALGPERVAAFIGQEQGLDIFRHELDDTLRRKEHTGTAGEERIIATASLMSDGPETIYGVFAEADFPFPDLTLADGTQVRLDKPAFSIQRASTNRDDRRAAFAAYFGRLHDYRRTFGAQLYAQVKRDMFYARARNYTSCLNAALDSSNIPLEVYHSLVRNVRASLPVFHRSLDLRRKLLGLDVLHYHDLYAPIVPNVDIHYPYDAATSHVLASLAVLGEDYVETVRRAFGERWIDVYPSGGKRSGAYSNGGAYDVHPYILMNYTGNYDDVSTLAHELGHTMHSYLTNRSQPYPTSHYSIFVAEVASTFNEALLLDYMLKTIDDDGVRLSLLGNFLDGVRGTVFRQTQFAEFELTIHEMAERGETLTGDALSEVYLRLTREYYGHDTAICIVDDDIQAEWAHIPHFFYQFYVYQYATSFMASAALSERVLAGDREATTSFVDLLCAGGSDYPMNLLRMAGVDMATPEPFQLAMQKMGRVIDEMGNIVATRGNDGQRG